MTIPTLEALREQRASLVAEVNELRDLATTETRDLTDDELETSNGKLDEVEKIDKRIKDEERAAPHLKPALTQNAAVETRNATEILNARPKNPDAEEKTYRPDNMREANFWKDIASLGRGDADVHDRLNRNTEQAFEWYETTRGRDYARELRDMGTGSTAGAEFMPPLYLADLWVHPLMAGRPLADRLPKYPLPPTGIAISIPKFTSGITVAARASGGAVSETDGVTATISHDVNEYAGLVDIDRIAVMRSDPGLQDVLTRTLVRRYNVALDVDLISGSGTAPHHCGIDNLGAGLNTVTWTQASPTPALFVSQTQKGISQIDTTRLEESPDLIVMHGRRMAWGGQPNSTTFSVFGQSGMFHVIGTQDGGFITTVAGLEVLKDNNITTTAGSGTNQDKVYILVSSDFLLAEGPLYAKVHEGVGSGTGAIRYTVFAHSAFLSKRYPTGAAIVTGTGLAAPAFDS